VLVVSLLTALGALDNPPIRVAIVWHWQHAALVLNSLAHMDLQQGMKARNKSQHMRVVTSVKGEQTIGNTDNTFLGILPCLKVTIPT
jgi:hypothetical protein